MADIYDERAASIQAAQDIFNQAIGKPLYDPKGRMDFNRRQTTSAQDTRTMAINDMVRRIMQEENSKSNPNGGWDKATGRWYPHTSHEGGAKTIGYGTKLSNGGPIAKLAMQQGYLTDEQAIQGETEESGRYYDNAKKVFDRRYGNGSWDQLNFKQQSLLGDVEFGVKGGLATFPKLMQAAYDGDIDAMERESARYDAQGRPLGRNAGIKKDIDSLRTHYPVTPVTKPKD